MRTRQWKTTDQIAISVDVESRKRGGHEPDSKGLDQSSREQAMRAHFEHPVNEQPEANITRISNEVWDRRPAL